MEQPGELAIVLHTHMPYVEGGAPWPPPDRTSFLRNPEGFGTWPFGEEWLWEAVATSYLPLLDVLAGPGGGAITVSLTPVLCDQLESPGAVQRCVRFLDEIRPESHRRDAHELRAAGQPELAAELDRSAAEYAAASRRLAGLGAAGLLGALGAQATWTSSATHAVLPLVATDTGLSLQVQTGIASHRRRFGAWHGGFWLPECGYAPWLDPLLHDAGVRASCVELTRLFGLGDPRHLQPLALSDGPVLWPLDRQTMSLVWSDDGYPAGGAYRDYHRHTTHRHQVWGNDGGAYDHAAAVAAAQADAADFVARVRDRVAGGGVCVCGLDTELLGHWWYEGVHWLQAVIDEAARQGLALTTLDDALERHPRVPAPTGAESGVTSWGEGGDLRTWSGPRVAEFAWRARAAELAVLGRPTAPSDRALRELLALQASDWAFLESGRLAGDYARERADGHYEALQCELNGTQAGESRLRGLAPDLAGWTG